MMAIDFQFKKNYNFDDLINIVGLLREPDGCPWDREQDHKSIRSNFIEETYEAIEAIDTQDTPLLCEELGDVLLQVAMHSRMEQEIGSFSIDDVIDGVCKKLIVRHPHVFGDVKADNTSQVLKNWDEIKKQTKGQKTDTDTLNSVARTLPSLMRTAKVQKRAAKAGFDFSSVEAAREKLTEEMTELDCAVKNNDKENINEEVGDLLFAAVNVARHLGVEPEGALTKSCDKFVNRFALCEKFAQEKGKALKGMSEEELDELWCKAKAVLQSKTD